MRPTRRPRRTAAAASRLGVTAATVAAVGVALTAAALASGVQLDLLDASEAIRAPEAHPTVHDLEKRTTHEHQYHLDYVLPRPVIHGDINVTLTPLTMRMTIGTVTPVITYGPSVPVQLDLFAVERRG